MGEQEFERGSRLPNASPLPEQGLILMAAATGRPIKEEWWDRLIEKLKTRPIGTQELLVIEGFLRQRHAGIQLPEERLEQIYTIMLIRKLQTSIKGLEVDNP